MNQETLVEAVKTALHTLHQDAPPDATTSGITTALTEMDLDPIIDRAADILLGTFQDLHAAGQCQVEHTPEGQIVAAAAFLRETMFILAVSAGYKLGHTAATEMFDQASAEIENMSGGDGNE